MMMYPPSVIDYRELQYALKEFRSRGYPLGDLKLNSKKALLLEKYKEIYNALKTPIPLGADQVVVNRSTHEDKPTTYLPYFQLASPWKYIKVVSEGYYDSFETTFPGECVYSLACERPRC